MPGRQLPAKSIGAAYEAFAEAVLGRIASMAPVPYEQDFGVDFYALPRVRLPDNTETVVELCSVQVKGGEPRQITFGGLDDKGGWKRHEVDWLRGLNVPLYIATVDRGFTVVRLYSTSPVVGVFFQSGTPFKITCSLGESALSSDATPAGLRFEPANHAPGSDGHDWHVDLCAPALELRLPELLEQARRDSLRDVFVSWIQADRVAQVYLRQHVPTYRAPSRYRTNERPTEFLEWLFWNPTPGVPSRHLEREIAPLVTALVQHLLGQNDDAALQVWLPILQWLDQRGNLTGMGKAAIAEVTGRTTA